MGETLTVRMTCGICEKEVPVVVPRDAKVRVAVEAMLRVHDPARCTAKVEGS